MASDNSVTIVGNLADDPELRHTTNGVPVASVRVAVNQRYFNKDAGSWDERLDGFFSCNVWRDYAEHVKTSLHRGDRVLVTGRLRSRSYEDKDGVTKWVTEIEVDEICPSLRFHTATLAKVPRSRRPAEEDGAANGETQREAGAETGPAMAEAVPF